MITYIFKTILCSSLLILIYYLFLEREKMHRFNRFYLLFSIIFSFIVPLITINIKSTEVALTETINLFDRNFQKPVSQQILLPINENYSLSNILILVYVTLTVFLFARFLINISIIFYKIKSNKSFQYQDAKIVLTNDTRAPHSFLKYIFVYLKDFEGGTIEKEILSHELTHVKQRHSIDILFIEFLMIFAWINPIILIYRKAVQLNHEFLADEFVVNSISNTQTYQLLLVEKATQTNYLLFSSPFNYLLTKKRIIMMSQKVSRRAAILKQIALVPVIVSTGFLFTTKTVAQEKISTPQQKIESTQSGVSQELLKEYGDIVNKYKRTLKNGQEGYNFNLSKVDRERLEKIFFQMTKDQQAHQIFTFIPKNSMVLKRSVPSKEQLESYKDPKMYGVWIDGDRVNNDVLIKYKNTDFAQFFESILLKNATNYGKHVYQVNLMTNDYYQNYYNKQISDKGYILVAHKGGN